MGANWSSFAKYQSVELPQFAFSWYPELDIFTAVVLIRSSPPSADADLPEIERPDIRLTSGAPKTPLLSPLICKSSRRGSLYAIEDRAMT